MLTVAEAHACVKFQSINTFVYTLFRHTCKTAVQPARHTANSVHGLDNTTEYNSSAVAFTVILTWYICSNMFFLSCGVRLVMLTR